MEMTGSGGCFFNLYEMDIRAVTNEIINSLKSLQDNKRKAMSERNYPSALEIIGVTVPNIKKVLKELIQTTKNWPVNDKKQLAIELTQTNYHECHHLAYYYLEKEKKILKALTKDEVLKLGACLDNWVLVDSYCTFILGVHWRIGNISDEYIHQLASSENVWDRRCALVSTVALNQPARGGKGDTLQTIAVCETAVGDKHPMVVKALSWALRVLIGHDRQAVESFLLTHNDNLHNQIKREVLNKLDTGLKNPK